MKKFIKGVMEFGKDFGLKRKAAVLLNAQTMSKDMLVKIYSIYFWSIDGFAGGGPSRWQVYGWEKYVIPGIDTEFNLDSQKIAKEILVDWKKKKSLTPVQMEWIKLELKPYFEESLLRQTGKTVGMLDAVSEGKMDEYLKSFKKESKGRFK